MEHWIKLIAAGVCFVWGFGQIRMYRVYTGRSYSPTLGLIEGGPLLKATAIKSAISGFTYGAIIAFVTWPQLVTYITLYWVVREALESVLGWYGRGTRAFPSGERPPQLKKRYLLVESFGVFIRVVIFLLALQFLGMKEMPNSERSTLSVQL